MLMQLTLLTWIIHEPRLQVLNIMFFKLQCWLDFGRNKLQMQLRTIYMCFSFSIRSYNLYMRLPTINM